MEARRTRRSLVRSLPRSQPALAASLAILVVLVFVLGCGAPRSRAAGGAIAQEIQAALDSGTEKFGHNDWERLVATGSHKGLVDYRAFQDHLPRLDAYLERIEKVDLASLEPGHLEALLINAYNALTIRSILEHPHVASIREIDGVWTERRHRVGGFDLTLDEIEHNILRPFYKDPRIHFVVNCASKSCAPLPFWAYDGAKVVSQLDHQTRAFLNRPENVRVEDDVLYLSRYFDWYGDDFVKEDWAPRADTVALFIAEHIQYSRPELYDFIMAADGNPKIAYLDYDWSLNAAKPPDPSFVPE